MGVDGIFSPNQKDGERTVGGGEGAPCPTHLPPLAPAEVKAGGGSLLLDGLGDEGGRKETVWGALGEAAVHYLSS